MQLARRIARGWLALMLRSLRRRLKIAGLERRMRNDWDQRAREDALHFVNTARRGWDEDEFFATGEQSVREHILNDMENVCQGRDPARMRVLEIGCGVGRMTRALAAIFGEVHGVDVSEEMVRQARTYLDGVANAHVHLNSGSELAVLGSLDFDFAYSFIVFQHIPSREIIDRYVGEVARCLRPGSMFKFQVQGFLGAGLREPRTDTWLGASVSEAEAERMAARHGFELRHSVGAGTQYFWLWFYKPERSRGA